MAHVEKPGSVIKKDSAIISNQGGLSGAEKPFDAMNNIVANLLLNITRYNNSLLCCFVILMRLHITVNMTSIFAVNILQHNLALDGHMSHNPFLFNNDFPCTFFLTFVYFCLVSLADLEF